MIKAVAFDLDNTLVRSATDFSKMRLLIRGYIRRHMPSLQGVDSARTTIELLERVEKMDALDGREGHLERIHEIMDRVELESVSKIAPMEGAASCLSQLREMGLRIGVLTRSCPAYTRAALERTGLSEFVDASFSRTAGEPVKPDPRSIAILAGRLGVPTRLFVMVGDHESDAECARLAGIPFVQLASTPESKPLRSTATIASLEELPSTIRDLSRRGSSG